MRFILIINFSWIRYNNTPFLKDIYIPFFKKYFKYKCHIVLYGPIESKKYGIKSNGLKPNGYYSYKSLIIAYEEYSFYDGYIFINDDGFLNPILFNLCDFSKIIIESIHYINTSTNIWPFIKKKNENSISYYNSLNEVVKYLCSKSKYKLSKLCKSYYPPYIIGGWSDFFFIPKLYIKEVVEIMKIFYKNLVFLESTITTISQLFKYDVIWKKCTLNKLYYLFTCPFVHPIKYSHKNNRKLIETIIHQYNSKFDLYSSKYCVRCNITAEEYFQESNESKNEKIVYENSNYNNLINI